MHIFRCLDSKTYENLICQQLDCFTGLTLYHHLDFALLKHNKIHGYCYRHLCKQSYFSTWVSKGYRCSMYWHWNSQV